MIAGQGSDFRRELGQQLRVDSVRCSAAAGSGHPPSSMSAADIEDVGWPEPAAALQRTESTRSCWPSSRRKSEP